MKRCMLVLFICAFAFTLTPISKVEAAQHYDGSCIVTDVSFNDDTWGRVLFIACSSGGAYYAFLSGGGTPSGCQITPSMDYVKLWETIATSAYLSGRTAAVSYDTVTNCGGTKNVIRAVELH